MNDIISTVVLAFIQGIAEFLPISSSAHLIIFRDVFGIGSMTASTALCFDIALHLGTLLAILVFFFSDFWKMITSGLTKGTKEKDGRLFWQLVVATIPAAIVGVLFEDVIEDMIRTNYVLIAFALIFMGIVIYVVDKKSKEEKTVKEINFKEAFLIGCVQVFALIPGFSRSGTTITAARVAKVNRADAAKFSFYLSAPVVLGACVIQLFKSSTISIIASEPLIFILGILVSFIIGLLCIKFLLKYLRKHDFKIFMIYRIILAIVVLITVLF